MADEEHTFAAIAHEEEHTFDSNPFPHESRKGERTGLRAAPTAARHGDDVGGWNGSGAPGSGSHLSLTPSTSVGRWVG
jgi:hypothetical protein